MYSINTFAFITFHCRWIWWMINVQMENMNGNTYVWNEDEHQIVSVTPREITAGQKVCMWGRRVKTESLHARTLLRWSLFRRSVFLSNRDVVWLPTPLRVFLCSGAVIVHAVMTSQRNVARFSQFLSVMNRINAVFYNQYLKGNDNKWGEYAAEQRLLRYQNKQSAGNEFHSVKSDTLICAVKIST